MPVERIETLIIGAGQAGLAMSEQLSRRGLPHCLVERGRIAERWHSERWDGLHSNGPAWHDRLPALPIAGTGADDFATRDQLTAYFAAYAAHIAAPVRCGVAVTSLRRSADGFHARTSNGAIAAGSVVVATGPFQRPVVPTLVPEGGGIAQLHSSAYRNPAALGPGAVLVVGAGSSGSQIADELRRAGRRVYLSVGRHGRPPRRYRGRDCSWWMDVLGTWAVPARPAGDKHVTIAVSGAYGGRTVDFRRLAADGVTLLGRAVSFDDGAMRFADGLAADLAEGDASLLAFLDAADAYAAREGLDLPEEPAARHVAANPDCVTSPVRELDLREAGITQIIWATGYELDHGWLEVDAFDARGAVVHDRGVTQVPGLYFIGLSWLSCRASSFIFGAAHDAAYLGDVIAARR